MHYRKLGDSDLEVSEISLGSWLTYGVGVEADAARACLDEAFAQGVNFIDTANVYGRGAAETFLGEALKGRPRDSFVLATKLFFPMGGNDSGLSRAQVDKQLDASLRRLQTDVIDLYQCHRYDEATPLEETEALTRASPVAGAHHRPFPVAADATGATIAASKIVSAAAFTRLARARDAVSLGEPTAFAVVCRRSAGRLSGTYDRQPPPATAARRVDMGIQDRLMQPGAAAVQDKASLPAGCTAQFALAGYSAANALGSSASRVPNSARGSRGVGRRHRHPIVHAGRSDHRRRIGGLSSERLRCSARGRFEHFLDRLLEQFGDAECQRQRGRVAAGLDRVDALARYVELGGEVALAPAALGAHHREPGNHRRRPANTAPAATPAAKSSVTSDLLQLKGAFVQ